MTQYLSQDELDALMDGASDQDRSERGDVELQVSLPRSVMARLDAIQEARGLKSRAETITWLVGRRC